MSGPRFSTPGVGGDTPHSRNSPSGSSVEAAGRTVVGTCRNMLEAVNTKQQWGHDKNVEYILMSLSINEI